MPDDGGAPLVAVTGASGFLGGRIVQALIDRGARVRALARRPLSTPFSDVVLGDLADRAALTRLVAGASAIVHCAGIVKALGASGFNRVNRLGAATMAAIARETAPDARYVLISSLAAREPRLSPYSASKRAGEAATAAAVAVDRLVVVRPPAIYGPGDRDFLPLFRAVTLRTPFPVFGSADARVALIHVADATTAVVDLTLGALRPGVWTLSDDCPQGYAWRDIAQAAARAVGAPAPRFVAAPAAALKAAAAAGALAARMRGRATILTPGKARELLHPDWSVQAHERAPDLPPPRYGLEEGFRETEAWYRSHGEF